jgi:methionyl-tRNA formyltransferase
MNIAVLTANEPLYLPRFFSQFLPETSGSVRVIFMAPPRYGKDSGFAMARRYIRAFGVANLLRLGWRTTLEKTLDRLGVPARDRYRSISSAARAHGVRCETVQSVNDPLFIERLRQEGIDLVISVSCPQVFKKSLIELPKFGCLNVHGAILPKYRGIAPSFWMMTNGESEAGVTIFLVNEGIDAGDVVISETFPIKDGESLHDFIIRSKQIACRVLLRAIELVQTGNAPTRPLDTTSGSYFGFPTAQAYREFRRRGRRLW